MMIRFTIFMLCISIAFVLMIVAWVRMLGFVKRNRQPEQDTLNPLNGPRLWIRFFTKNGWGTECESERASIAGLYIRAFLFYLLACAVFVFLPFVPGLAN